MSNVHGKRIRTLAHGEQPPEGVEPRRYRNSGGYIRLRWNVSPLEQVECYEHRWVMGNPPANVQVHHKNGVRDDNRPENLEVVTPTEHAAEHTTYDHAEIVRLYESGLSTPQISERLGCDASVAYRTLRRAGVQPRTLSESVAASWANGRRR